MGFFTAIENGKALVHSGGTYRELPLFHESNLLYVKKGDSFIKLKPDGATSVPKVRWDKIDAAGLSYGTETFNLVLHGPAAIAAE